MGVLTFSSRMIFLKQDLIRIIAIAGGIGKDASDLYKKGIDSIFSIVDKPMMLEDAIDNAEALLEETAERTMRVAKLFN